MQTFNRCSSVRLILAITLVAASNAAAPLLAPRPAQAQDLESKKIVPFVPTPQEVVDKMIELAGVKKGDVVYDLGSGDGRIVITAAKKGARAVGFDVRSEEHTSELQSLRHLVCRLLLEK